MMMGMPSVVIARRSWALALLAALTGWALWGSGAIDVLERPVGDVLLRLRRPPINDTVPFVAVLIDDRSVDSVGPLPWRRSTLASLIESIRSQGVRGIIVDILLVDPGPEVEDDALADALEIGPTILAAVLTPRQGWLLPLDRFGGASRAAHGHAEVAADGVTRAVASTKQFGGLSLPALSVAAARLAGWSNAIPVGETLRPDFRQPPESMPAVSAGDVLAGANLTTDLAGKVVFVGLSASGAGDQFVVPVGLRHRPSPGVLVHASIASSIVRGGLLVPAGGWLVLLLMSTAAVATQWTRTRSGRMAVFRLAAFTLLVVAATVIALWWGGLQLPLVSLLLVVAMSAAGREAVESVEAQREAGAVLASLLDTDGPSAAGELPPGVGGRLRLARSLQRQIARDAELRSALLESLREGVVLWDAHGRSLLANQSAGRLWGSSPTLADVTSALGRSSDGDSEMAGEVETQGRRLEVEVRPIKAGMLGLLRDVTAARELDRSRREVQRMVSHELKTPLSSISGFGAMIERYELSREEQLRVAGLIRGEADRLADMVRSFLDLERLGAGSWEGDRAEVDLRALVVSRCDFLRNAAEQSNHRILTPPGREHRIIGSEELLTRLIDNLVGNAVKHTPAGTEVQVTVETAGDTVELAVADDGPGIDPTALPRLFDRFFRGSESGAGGSGLGLALVQEIAHWHGAKVGVESDVNRGTIFTVRFPAIAAMRSDDDG